MPRYNCLDTEVQVCMWDPPGHDALVLDSSHPATAINSYSTSGSGSKIVPGASIPHKANTRYEPAQSYKLNTLKEEFFTGCEGLDFLGCGIPFFLIQAGKKDLSSLEAPQGTGNSSFTRDNSHLEFSQTPVGSQYLNTSSAPARAVPDISYLGLPLNAGDLCQSDPSKLSLLSDVSSLSVLSSTAFLSPHGTVSQAKEPGVEIGKQTLASRMTHKHSKSTGNNISIPVRASALESLSKPILVKIKLSDKSFFSPLSSANTDRYDICINIFYNGELNASQVIQYSAWTADGQHNLLNFGGRRIDACYELPWMLVTGFQNVSGPAISRGVNSKALSSLERWNKLAEMLIVEADEWGRDERGYRCPTGEYLELLSEKRIPPDLLTAPANKGSEFGVIDVIITFGRGSRFDNAKLIVSPPRNLPEGQLRRRDVIDGTKHTSSAAMSPLVITADLSMTSSDPMGLTNSDLSVHRAASRDAPRSPSIVETTHAAVALVQPYNQIISGAPAATRATTNVIRGASPEAVVRQAVSMTASTPTVLATSSTPRPPHPHKPQKVPQKRYRGSEPILPEPKRQKVANYLEELPLDLNASTYMSTRSRRSASMPFPQTIFTQLRNTNKKNGSITQARGALVNAEYSALPTTAAPSTPKKTELNDPKTPASKGSVKKYARPTRFNSKYSNRPQNLRRKNSKGEWFIPISRKSGDGEWETPTKNKNQNHDIGINSPGELTDETTPEGTRRILQPAFTALADNSRDMSIELMTANIPPIAMYSDTLKKNVSQMSTARQTDAIARTTRVFETEPPPLTSLFQDMEGNPNEEAPGSAVTKIVETFQPGDKAKNTITGIEKDPRRKSLRIRFSQANKIASDEAIGTSGTRIWQAERYASPVDIAAPAGLDVIPATRAHSALRDTVVDATQQPQTLDILKSRPRFMVPSPKSRVLKLVSRQGVGTESEAGKQGALGITDQDVYQSLPKGKVATNAIRDPDTIHVRDHSVLDAHGSSPGQATELRNSSVPQSVMATSSETNAGSDTNLTNFSKSEAQTKRSDPAPGQLPTGVISKPPPRPRTVGSSELKQLLESHDHGNAVNTSPGAPLGTMHARHMTRATRKAVSNNVGKDIIPNDDFGDTQVQSDTPPVKLPGTSKRALRKRTSSVGVIEKTIIAALSKKDTNIAVSKATDAQNYGKFNPTEATEDRMQPTLSQNGDTPEPNTVAVTTDELSLLSAGGLTPTVKPKTPKFRLPASRLQQVLETPAVSVVGNEEESITSASNSETAVAKQSGCEIKKPTSRGPKAKDVTLLAVASIAAEFKEAVSKVDPPSKQGDKTQRTVIEATEESESLTAHTPTMKTFPKPATIRPPGEALPFPEVIEKSVTQFQGVREQEATAPSTMVPGIGGWKPGCLCEDSILRYAENGNSVGLERNPMTGQLCRQMGTQEEGHFRALGVLMGVRYVIVGSEVLKEPEVRYERNTRKWPVAYV